MATEVLYLTSLVADDVNMAANDYLHHSLSLPSLAGFAHRIERYLNELGGEFDTADTAILPIVRHFSSQRGFPRGVTYDYGSAGKAGAPRLMFQYQGRVRLDLMIAFEVDDYAVSVSELLESESDKLALCDFLARCHLAGGRLQPVKLEQIVILKECALESNLEQLPAAGYLLEDVSELLEHPIDEAWLVSHPDDRLQRLLALTSRNRDGGRSEQGYLTPAAVGYRLLEEPALRYQRDPQQQYLHAFVEPLMGVIRLRSTASYRKQFKQQPISAWWRYQESGNALYLSGFSYSTLNAS